MPTEDTTPGVTAPSGRVTATLSPGLISACWAASRLIVTTGVTEVAVMIVPEAAAPSDASSFVTRSAAGLNTTWPSGRLPVTGRPR